MNFITPVFIGRIFDLLTRERELIAFEYVVQAIYEMQANLYKAGNLKYAGMMNGAAALH